MYGILTPNCNCSTYIAYEKMLGSKIFDRKNISWYRNHVMYALKFLITSVKHMVILRPLDTAIKLSETLHICLYGNKKPR